MNAGKRYKALGVGFSIKPGDPKWSSLDIIAKYFKKPSLLETSLMSSATRNPLSSGNVK